MSGSFWKTARKPRSSASSTSDEPGSVIAAKWSPALSSPTASRTRAKKYSNCDRVSIVPPDFDETRNSVFDRSTACSAARTASASVESSTCSVMPSSSFPNERRKTSGASDDPPIPSSTTSVSPSAMQVVANSYSSLAWSSIDSLIVSQPRRFDSSGVSLSPPQSVGSFCQTRWATCSSAARLMRSAGDDGLALRLDAGYQLLHRVLEQLHAVAQELVRHVVQVDARIGQRLELLLHLVGVDIRRRARHLAVVGEREQRRHRHRVDRVRRDQVVDVHRVGVVRVLHAGRRPQRALHGGACVAQIGEAVAVEYVLEAQVGGAGVGDRGGAQEVGPAPVLQALVDLG